MVFKSNILGTFIIIIPKVFQFFILRKNVQILQKTYFGDCCNLNLDAGIRVINTNYFRCLGLVICPDKTVNCHHALFQFFQHLILKVCNDSQSLILIFFLVYNTGTKVLFHTSCNQNHLTWKCQYKALINFSIVFLFITYDMHSARGISQLLSYILRR